MKAKEIVEFLLKHPDANVQRQDTNNYGDPYEVDVYRCEIVLQEDGTETIIVR